MVDMSDEKPQIYFMAERQLTISEFFFSYVSVRIRTRSSAAEKCLTTSLNLYIAKRAAEAKKKRV